MGARTVTIPTPGEPDGYTLVVAITIPGELLGEHRQILARVQSAARRALTECDVRTDLLYGRKRP